jgi:hypothetical protein
MDTENGTDVVTREVTEWMYRKLDWDIVSPSGGGGFVNPRQAGDFRKVEGMYALEVFGDGAGYFEVHTSDGSIFTVHVGRKK